MTAEIIKLNFTRDVDNYCHKVMQELKDMGVDAATICALNKGRYSGSIYGETVDIGECIDHLYDTNWNDEQ